MSDLLRFPANVPITFPGQVIFGGAVTLPPNVVGSDQVRANSPIAASKVIHQFPLRYAQAHGSTVAAVTIPLHIARAAGRIVAVQASITGQAPTGDRQVDVDIQKGSAATAFATVLDEEINFANGDAVRAVKSGVITSEDFAAGDQLLVVVTVTAGSTGDQPQGLNVVVTVWEQPN